MELINQAINLLGAVMTTMDTIPIKGVEYQSAFVGCAEAVQTVTQLLEKHVQEAQAAQKNEVEKEEVNGG